MLSERNGSNNALPEQSISVAEAKQNWKFSKDNSKGGYKISAYLGTEECPVIPEIIANTNVVAIGNGAFRNNLQLTGITLPKTLTHIGTGAFRGCRNLSEIVLPDAVSELPKAVFAGCESLKLVVLPASLEVMDPSAFGTDCQDEFIYECNSLEKFVIDSANNTFATMDGVLYNKDLTKIIIFPKGATAFTVPESMETLDRGVCENANKLETVVLHDAVKNIGAFAFNGCSALTEIEIPASVKSIERYAFYLLKSLKRITVCGKNTKLADASICYCPNVTIHAPAGSYAEAYATEKKIPFVAE